MRAKNVRSFDVHYDRMIAKSSQFQRHAYREKTNIILITEPFFYSIEKNRVEIVSFSNVYGLFFLSLSLRFKLESIFD